MIVFRLCKQLYCRDLSGTGAFKAGGRWNSKGTAVVYTAESRALCLAEVAVHVPVGILPKDFFLVTLELPDSSIAEITGKALPENWNAFPHPYATQILGDAFIKEGNSLALKVPSVVVPGDFNYLVNPQHKLMQKAKMLGDPIPFPFDVRLFKK